MDCDNFRIKRSMIAFLSLPFVRSAKKELQWKLADKLTLFACATSSESLHLMRTTHCWWIESIVVWRIMKHLWMADWPSAAIVERNIRFFGRKETWRLNDELRVRSFFEKIFWHRFHNESKRRRFFVLFMQQSYREFNFLFFLSLFSANTAASKISRLRKCYS